jgi:hypothetical protein
VTENGYGKRTDIDEYRLTARGAQGVNNLKATGKVGKTTAILPVDETSELMVISQFGKMIRIDTKTIRAAGRSTSRACKAAQPRARRQGRRGRSYSARRYQGRRAGDAAAVTCHRKAHANVHRPGKQSRHSSDSAGPGASRSSRAYAGVGSRRLRGETRAAMRRRIRLARSSPEVVAARLNIPPPLRGSHESLVHQNEMAEADGLERILDDADLEDRIAHGSLVPVPVSAGLHVNTDLPENRRYCRPWTAKFLTDLSHAHSQRFSASAIEVTSAVRTVAYQRQLRRINGNAAAADGDIASPHLTGGTIDIAKQGLSAREIGWIRAWLIPLEQQGKIDVEEEFRQSCFHISVYKSYTETAPTSTSPANAAPVASASILAAHGR